MQLNYIRLLTDCFDEMVEFYRDTMELEPKFVDKESKYAEFNAGNVTLAIFDCNSMAKALDIEKVPHVHECFDKDVIIFRVDDVDQIAKKLAEKNVVFIKEVTDRPEWGIKTLHFRDPSGNLIEVNQPISME